MLDSNRMFLQWVILCDLSGLNWITVQFWNVHKALPWFILFCFSFVLGSKWHIITSIFIFLLTALSGYFDGLVHDCSNTLEILHSYTKSSIWPCMATFHCDTPHSYMAYSLTNAPGFPSAMNNLWFICSYSPWWFHWHWGSRMVDVTYLKVR